MEKKESRDHAGRIRGRKAAIRPSESKMEFTTLDRIHRAMTLFPAAYDGWCSPVGKRL